MKIKFKKLFLNLVVLIIAVVAALMLYLSYTIKEARVELAEKAIKRLSEQSINQFKAAYQPVEQITSVLRDWGENDILYLDDPQRLSAQMIPLLKEIQMISGLSIADEKGYSYYIYSEENTWVLRSHLIGDELFKWTRIDSAGNKIDYWQGELDYDPHNRPWYLLGTKNDSLKRPIWTKPYTFYKSQEWGVSGTVSWREKDGNLIVAAIDIPLKELFNNISTFSSEYNAQSFLFNDLEQIYDPENAPHFFMSTDSSEKYFKSALKFWTDSVAYQSYSFEWSQSTYWIGLQPLDLANRVIWLATFSKEEDYFSVLGNRAVPISVVASIIILVGIFIAYWLVRGAKSEETHPIIDMNDFENSIRSIIQKGEGTQIEFKSSVRINLHSNNPGKEIELAWLKGLVAFMNTRGGVLLIGVSDDGEIIGNEIDRFANDDKCLLHIKNCIKDHIGPSFFQYLEYGVRAIEDKNVIYLMVKQASVPVYLKPKADEEVFYIRSGPASEKLSVSKVVNYLNRRKVMK